MARKAWTKFGACEGQGSGPEDGITRREGVCTIQITKHQRDLAKTDVLRLAFEARRKAVSSKTPYTARRMTSLLGSDTSGEDFWKQARERYYNGKDGSSLSGERAGGLSMKHQRESGGYKPPALRAGVSGAVRPLMPGSTWQDETPGVRISNISMEAGEGDLQELCRPFGALQRMHLAKDKYSGLNKGYAFVNFRREVDAASAIEVLNGHGYDNLILRAEWAKPSRKPSGGRGGSGRSYCDRAPFPL